MIKNGGGAIIHNASIDGIAAERGYVVYSCTKAALISLAKTMAVELASHKIRVNCVSPGYTRTELTEKDTGPELLRQLDSNFERVPMHRLARPDEIAATFTFLASDDASFITGQNIVVDGGLTANLYILETLSSKNMSS
jgi:NAD(P)-dependent dehydrogenase (short-subunit alcohol dehydrogenase family)